MSSLTIDTIAASAAAVTITNKEPSTTTFTTTTDDTTMMTKKSLPNNSSRNHHSHHHRFNFTSLKIPTGGFKMTPSSSGGIMTKKLVPSFLQRLPSGSGSGSGSSSSTTTTTNTAPNDDDDAIAESAARARASARASARAALSVVVSKKDDTDDDTADEADDEASTPQEEDTKNKKQEEEETVYLKALEKLKALEELRNAMNNAPFHNQEGNEEKNAPAATASSSMVSQEDTIEEESTTTTTASTPPAVDLRQEEDEEEQASVPNKKAKTTTTASANVAVTVDLLDDIDLDNITVHDLQGLTGDDGDILRAKHLNKLSRVEREHVSQDIHGVAEFPIMDNSFIDASLKKLSIELKNELLSRQQKQNNTVPPPPPPPPQEAQTQPPAVLPVLKEKLGKLQNKLDELVRGLNHQNPTDIAKLSSTYQGNAFKMDYPTSVAIQRNHHNIGSAMSIPSGLFSDSSSGNNNNVASTTTTSATKTTTTAIEDEALQDDAILKSSTATAYEQALAQCRGRRRERNSSLFRHNALYDEDEVNEDDYDNEYDNDDDKERYLDVESYDFLLSFLRCDRFDYKKATIRIFDYFEEKKLLFGGLDFLTTRIQLKDLDIDTKQCLDSGCIQLLPGRDRYVRLLLFIDIFIHLFR
jgi:hypothetical protein